MVSKIIDFFKKDFIKDVVITTIGQIIIMLAAFALNKIIIGCSAGALVLTSSLELIDMYSPEMNIVGLGDLSACQLTEIQLLPHYSKFLNRYNDFEEKCTQYEQEKGCNVIRLNDGEGVFIDGVDVTIIK